MIRELLTKVLIRVVGTPKPEELPVEPESLPPPPALPKGLESFLPEKPHRCPICHALLDEDCDAGLHG